MRAAHGTLGLLLTAVAAVHGAVAWQGRLLRPDLSIIDPAPDARTRKALSLGDDQFLYRAWLLDLQNAGDTGGRSTPMRDYNYAYVLSWLEALQSLDPQAQGHLQLAAHYFAMTPRSDDVRTMIGFIERDALRMPREKLYWLVQAAIMAEVHLHDLDYALALSRRIVALEIPDLPVVIRLMPVLFLEKLGRLPEARTELEGLAAAWAESLTPQEKFLVNDILHRLTR